MYNVSICKIRVQSLDNFFDLKKTVKTMIRFVVGIENKPLNMIPHGNMIEIVFFLPKIK